MALSNQDSFVLITGRYKVRLFSYIKRLTNIRDEDAEDLLQDIFLKVYLNLNNFNRKMKFSSWIYAIARNQVFSHHRKVSVRPEGHADVLDENISRQLITDINAIDIIDREISHQKISQAIFRLKSKYREVIFLRFFEEKSYQEISDIIRKPVGTVGSMLDRAKKELRDNFLKLKKYDKRKRI